MTIKQLIRRTIGQRYHIAIVAQQGTRTVHISSAIFANKRQLREYVEQMRLNRNYIILEVITFRSRMRYTLRTRPNPLSPDDTEYTTQC